MTIFFVRNSLIFPELSKANFVPKIRQYLNATKSCFSNGILIIFVVLLCDLVCAWGDRSEG